MSGELPSIACTSRCRLDPAWKSRLLPGKLDALCPIFSMQTLLIPEHIAACFRFASMADQSDAATMASSSRRCIGDVAKAYVSLVRDTVHTPCDGTPRRPDTCTPHRARGIGRGNWKLRRLVPMQAAKDASPAALLAFPPDHSPLRVLASGLSARRRAADTAIRGRRHPNYGLGWTVLPPFQIISHFKKFGELNHLKI